MYDVQLTKQAVKDAARVERAGLKPNVAKIIQVIRENPFQNPPPYEKLKGNLKDTYSRRINKQHRLVYDVLPNDENKTYKGVVKIIRMWTHYQ